MSGIVPGRPWGGDERSDQPDTELQGVRSNAEVLGRWRVRAAQYRAREATFMALASHDPILTQIPLIYVMGAAHE